MKFQISMDGFWLWVSYDDYKWYILVTLDEKGTIQKPFIIDSCQAHSFTEAFNIAKQIIKDALSQFPDNPSISPGWDWEYLHLYPSYDDF